MFLKLTLSLSLANFAYLMDKKIYNLRHNIELKIILLIGALPMEITDLRNDASDQLELNI